MCSVEKNNHHKLLMSCGVEEILICLPISLQISIGSKGFEIQLKIQQLFEMEHHGKFNDE